MKKLGSMALILLLTMMVFTGCGSKDGGAADSDGAAGGTVSTDGSTSMEKVIGGLAEAFEAANEGTTVTYNPTGSGSGITAVSEGRCDIGLSSRSLKEEEKSQGLQETILAYDGIAIIVNPENPVTDLSLEQIAKIYTGELSGEYKFMKPLSEKLHKGPAFGKVLWEIGHDLGFFQPQ